MFTFVEQEAAQQELSQQKEQYEERVTHLHEAMVRAVKNRCQFSLCNRDTADCNRRNILTILPVKALTDFY